MQGRIIKGIAGFYYVHCEDNRVCECKAKGIFRNEKLKPLVGDLVEIRVVDEEHDEGNIDKVFPRVSELVRPAVANIDKILLVFSVVKPRPNFNLLDRFFIMARRQGLETVICLNKVDLAEPEEIRDICRNYGNCGAEVLFCSAKERLGLEEIQAFLKGSVTAVAGPSGVGKSSLINCLQPVRQLETGEISRKIDRGKHTTRHTELITIDHDTYIMDTPGFSSLHMFDLEKEELRAYYEEFASYEPGCRFQGCSHTHEPGCGVKEALEKGNISRIRYENYTALYQELKDRKKY